MLLQTLSILCNIINTRKPSCRWQWCLPFVRREFSVRTRCSQKTLVFGDVKVLRTFKGHRFQRDNFLHWPLFRKLKEIMYGTIIRMIWIDSCVQGETFMTTGERITKRSMSCPLPNDTLEVHDRHLNFSSMRPADSNFDSLPPGGANQTYRVSVSNNRRHFGSSQTYTLYDSTCIQCSGSGLAQKVWSVA